MRCDLWGGKLRVCAFSSVAIDERAFTPKALNHKLNSPQPPTPVKQGVTAELYASNL